MTLQDAKICLDCGCLDWHIRQYSTTTIYGTMSYNARENGSYGDDFERDDDAYGNDDGNWEDSDDGPECQECGNINLMDLECLTPQQFEYLYKLRQEERAEIAQHMVAKDYEFPEDSQSKRKNLIGGKAVRQH